MPEPESSPLPPNWRDVDINSLPPDQKEAVLLARFGGEIDAAGKPEESPPEGSALDIGETTNRGSEGEESFHALSQAEIDALLSKLPESDEPGGENDAVPSHEPVGHSRSLYNYPPALSQAEIDALLAKLSDGSTEPINPEETPPAEAYDRAFGNAQQALGLTGTADSESGTLSKNVPVVEPAPEPEPEPEPVFDLSDVTEADALDIINRANNGERLDTRERAIKKAYEDGKIKDPPRSSPPVSARPPTNVAALGLGDRAPAASDEDDISGRVQERQEDRVVNPVRLSRKRGWSFPRPNINIRPKNPFSGWHLPNIGTPRSLGGSEVYGTFDGGIYVPAASEATPAPEPAPRAAGPRNWAEGKPKQDSRKSQEAEAAWLDLRDNYAGQVVRIIEAARVAAEGTDDELAYALGRVSSRFLGDVGDKGTLFFKRTREALRAARQPDGRVDLSILSERLEQPARVNRLMREISSLIRRGNITPQSDVGEFLHQTLAESDYQVVVEDIAREIEQAQRSGYEAQTEEEGKWFNTWQEEIERVKEEAKRAEREQKKKWNRFMDGWGNNIKKAVKEHGVGFIVSSYAGAQGRLLAQFALGQIVSGGTWWAIMAIGAAGGAVGGASTEYLRQFKQNWNEYNNKLMEEAAADQHRRILAREADQELRVRKASFKEKLGASWGPNDWGRIGKKAMVSAAGASLGAIAMHELMNFLTDVMFPEGTPSPSAQGQVTPSSESGVGGYQEPEQWTGSAGPSGDLSSGGEAAGSHGSGGGYGGYQEPETGSGIDSGQGQAGGAGGGGTSIDYAEMQRIDDQIAQDNAKAVTDAHQAATGGGGEGSGQGPGAGPDRVPQGPSSAPLEGSGSVVPAQPEVPAAQVAPELPDNVDILVKEGLVIPNGSTPWQETAKVLEQALGHPASNGQILEATKALCAANHISVPDVPEWGLPGGPGWMNHHEIPAGTRLTISSDLAKTFARIASSK